MSYIFVDYENVHHKGLEGLNIISGEDTVIILSNSSQMEGLTKLVETTYRSVRDQVYIYEADVGSSNALDYQLLGRVCSKIKSEPEQRYFIVSNDRGFMCVFDLIEAMGVLIDLASSVSDCLALSKDGRKPAYANFSDLGIGFDRDADSFYLVDADSVFPDGLTGLDRVGKISRVVMVYNRGLWPYFEEEVDTHLRERFPRLEFFWYESFYEKARVFHMVALLFFLLRPNRSFHIVTKDSAYKKVVGLAESMGAKVEIEKTLSEAVDAEKDMMKDLEENSKRRRKSMDRKQCIMIAGTPATLERNKDLAKRLKRSKSLSFEGNPPEIMVVTDYDSMMSGIMDGVVTALVVEESSFSGRGTDVPISVSKIRRWTGNYPDMEIILVISPDKKGGVKLQKLFDEGYYNALYSTDLNCRNIVSIMRYGRNPEIVYSYYGLDKAEPESRITLLTDTEAEKENPCTDSGEEETVKIKARRHSQTEKSESAILTLLYENGESAALDLGRDVVYRFSDITEEEASNDKGEIEVRRIANEAKIHIKKCGADKLITTYTNHPVRVFERTKRYNDIVSLTISQNGSSETIYLYWKGYCTYNNAQISFEEPNGDLFVYVVREKKKRKKIMKKNERYDMD